MRRGVRWLHRRRGEQRVAERHNNVFGRAFEYYKGNALQATDYFLKQAGEENPDSSSHIFGGHIGGPIVQNRLFYFGNLEYTHAKEAANLNFPMPHL